MKVASKSIFMETNNLVLETTLEKTTSTEKDIQDNINHYYHDQEKIESRLAELESEMDLETYLETENTAITIAGVILGLTVSRRWFILPLASSLVILARLVNKDRKPLPFLRRLGLRTRAEIDKEKYALKAIRGDFKYLLDVPNAVWNAVNK
jgi:hypothetical protein